MHGGIILVCIAHSFSIAFVSASYYLGVFAYTTMGSVIGSVVAGIIYDAERKRYRGKFRPNSKGYVFPITLPTLFFQLK